MLRYEARNKIRRGSSRRAILHALLLHVPAAPPQFLIETPAKLIRTCFICFQRSRYDVMQRRETCNPDRSNIKSSRAARASGTQRSASALARKRESTGVIKRGDQRRLTIGVHPPRYGWISRNRNEVLLPNVDAVPAFGRPPTTFHAS
jgi:hypothetical protein